jgi:hypothetical protein
MSASMTTSPSADTFTLFPDLPKELQIKIWKHAIPAPQLISIKFHPQTLEPRSGFRYRTNTKPSDLLRACKTSREEILKAQSVCIDMAGSERKICFDEVRDTVHAWQSATSHAQMPGRGFGGVATTLPDKDAISRGFAGGTPTN